MNLSLISLLLLGIFSLIVSENQTQTQNQAKSTKTYKESIQNDYVTLNFLHLASNENKKFL